MIESVECSCKLDCIASNIRGLIVLDCRKNSFGEASENLNDLSLILCCDLESRCSALGREYPYVSLARGYRKSRSVGRNELV